MIYVLAQDDRGLTAYETPERAISACEGIDVGDGNYRFFAADGTPLQATFLTPNRRGRLMVLSGEYVLEAPPGDLKPELLSQLKNVTYVEGCGLKSIDDVRQSIDKLRQADPG